MHNAMMDIKEFDSQESAKKEGYGIPLTAKEARMLGEMNRSQRRQWARSKGYWAPEEHNAWQKHQSERRASRKRVKAATLKMKRKARALARA